MYVASWIRLACSRHVKVAPGRCYIAGGRVIIAPEQLPAMRDGWDTVAADKELAAYQAKHNSKLSARLQNLFTVLVKRGRRTERDPPSLARQGASGIAGERYRVRRRVRRSSKRPKASISRRLSASWIQFATRWHSR